MPTQHEKFLIQLRASSVKPKPQNKTIVLEGQSWEIEWSTHVEIPMEIDYFNITIGRAIKQETEESEGAQKKIEEYWRISRIPPANRKIIYGINPKDATSIPAKPLEDGVYVIKITGMTNLAAGLEVMTAVGLAVVKIYTQSINLDTTPSSVLKDTADTTAAADSSQTQQDQQPTGPVKLTGKTISKIFDVLDSEDSDQK